MNWEIVSKPGGGGGGVTYDSHKQASHPGVGDGGSHTLSRFMLQNQDKLQHCWVLEKRCKIYVK